VGDLLVRLRDGWSASAMAALSGASKSDLRPALAPASPAGADFNSPHAGQTLVATVTVVGVRAPTPEEEPRGRV
jgi:hypothetical protein